jgi:hypothetical protein
MPEDMKAHLFKFDDHTNHRRSSVMTSIIKPELISQKLSPEPIKETYELELKSY